MLLLFIEHRDGSHLPICQRKVKDRDVFLDMLWITGTWDDAHPFLHMPAKDHLRRAFPVHRGNLFEQRVIKHCPDMPSAAQRIPALDSYPLVLDMLHHPAILIIRMDLILDQCWPYGYFRQERVHFLNIVTRNARIAHLALPHSFFDSAVCRCIIYGRMMQEHHINIADVQFLQCLIYGSGRMVILIWIQLGLHEDRFSRYARSADPFAHFPLIPIKRRRIDQTIATSHRRNHCVCAGLSMQGISSKADHRQIVRAEEIISMVDKTEAEFNSMSNIVSGDIYIGGGETEAVKLIAQIVCELRTAYPGIHYHLYSGNAEDVTERLDKGLLDFGILIQPADISKYDYINIPARDTWGVIMRKDSPLVKKETIRKEDLLNVPLICSRQAISEERHRNEFADWFGEDFDKLDIVTTFNLVYNAAIMVEAGVGYAITIDKIANTTESSSLCFRPLWPQLDSGLNVIWKKYQVFSAAAELFLEKLREHFG